jgi:hypothetical protein
MTYRAQEPGGNNEPDIKRPPDRDLPEIGRDLPDDLSDEEPAPPFTGEDVEINPDRRKRDRPAPM